jgi:sulfate-transporting ATPase
MTTFLQFAVLGLGLGAGYALLAQGLVVVQTGSGVINFAHGAMAMLGGFTFFELRQIQDWAFLPAFVASVALVTGVGVAVYQLVMRPLRNASALTRVIATLGVLLTIESVALLIWGEVTRIANVILPSGQVPLGGGITVGRDRLIMFGIATALTLALWAAYRFTPIGLAVRANAESERGAATLGWSGNLLGTLSWALGGALAALAGILLAPQTSLQVDELTLLVIPVLAAAVAGGFTSFPLTYLAAMAIGVGQSLVANYVLQQGVATALPFAIIIVFLVIRGKSLPVRGATSTLRLPELGTGRVRWEWLATVTVVFLALVWVVFPTKLVDALTVSLAWAIILLSVVVLMGYAGQVDLAPLAWGGIAALIVTRLIRVGVPFELAMLIGIAGAVPVGLLFALPALRARGLNLAVVTLGLGVMLHAMVFSNSDITGADFGGNTVGPQSLFGIDIGSFEHPQRYLTLVFVFFVALALLVAAVRRGRVGRRLIAVRTNERAAAALGISVLGSKLYAFGFSAALAATGGILLGFQFETIYFDIRYSPFQSMLASTDAVIGGIGFVLGPVLGSPLAAGGLGTWILNELFPGASGAWLAIIGGVGVLVILLQDPNGLVSMNLKAARASEGQSRLAYLRLEVLVLRAWSGVRRRLRPPRVAVVERLPRVTHELVELRPAALEIEGLTVRYGGVTAVDGVTLTIRPGEVVGVIGPNGAGKTSLIDAVTGFAPATRGEIRLDGRRIDRWPVHRRARAGVSRSFQNLELFESSTVEENLRVAADRRDARAYFTDLVAPGRSPLTPLTMLAIQELGLEDDLAKTPPMLSYGARRLTAIARAIAAGPSVLLLDEPVAGLSESETAELIHVVRRLASEWGLGVLVVEHDMGFVMGVCDRIAVLDFGRQIAEGTPAEVRANPLVTAAYLGDPEVSAPSVR